MYQVAVPNGSGLLRDRSVQEKIHDCISNAFLTVNICVQLTSYYCRILYGIYNALNTSNSHYDELPAVSFRLHSQNLFQYLKGIISGTAYFVKKMCIT
jgi:hypothetical protein